MMTMNYSTATRARRPLSDDNLRAIAPSIFATQPWGEVSSHYAFIPTSEVIRRLRAEGFVPVMAAQSRARLPGKSDFTRHMIRFQQPDYATDSRKVGDLIPEAVLVNSHDRTSSFELSAGLFRLVCTNGLVVSTNDSGAVRVRHSGDIADEVIAASHSIIKEAAVAIERARAMSAIKVEPPQQIAFAKAALQLRLGEENAPVQAEALLVPKRQADADPASRLMPDRNAFATMNVVQENLMVGGIRSRSSNGRRSRTRAISSVHEDMRLNKALWVLMEELAKAAA